MTRSPSIEVSDPQFESDNLRLITVNSPALGRRGDITLFLPPHIDAAGRIPLLLLLHGVDCSHWAWTLQGGAHRAAMQLMSESQLRPIAIAMPSDGLWGAGSGYLIQGSEDHETWIMNDVLESVSEVTAHVDRDSPLFIAGLSMGGYGALRLGAKHADRVAGISAHSAITLPEQMSHFVDEPLWGRVAAADPQADPLYWLQLHSQRLPPLRFDCGTSDVLFQANQQLHRRLTELNIKHTYQVFPGGHDWAYWQTHIYDTLLFVESTLRQG
jgi:S-formylglutathione hydrolase FrmB